MLKDFYLHPGMIHAKREPYAVTTVVGSCVSVCLWDPESEMGGMNHYLLPLWNGEGLSSPRYGNIAIQKLIDRMVAQGSRRERLRAKVFGGATLLGKPHPLLDIGGRNIRLAFETLEGQGIKVVSHDVGGDRGRKIIYNTVTGIARVKRLGVLGNRASRLVDIDRSTCAEPITKCPS
jgi:chemotaxis protein CheD